MTNLSNNQHDALTSKLDQNHQQALAAQDRLEKQLVSKINNDHRKNLLDNVANQRKLFSISETQQATLVNQTQLLRTSTRTQKQTAKISKTLDRASQSSNRNHGLSREMLTNLTNKVDQFEISLTKRSATVAQNGRDIHFIGERRDMIMAYLLPIKDQLNHAIDQILSQHIEGVSARHACWLEQEFNYLLGSAAQNEAIRYANSTATPFDQWFFSEDIVGSTMYGQDHQAPRVLDYTDPKDSTPQKRISPSRRKQSLQTVSFETAAGLLRVSFPHVQAGSRGLQDSDEISLSFTGRTSESLFKMNAYFYHKMVDTSRTKVCAQLNVFTTVPRCAYHDCWDLLETGTIEEVDTALRNNIISPYYLEVDGTNPFLYVSVILFSYLSILRIEHSH